MIGGYNLKTPFTSTDTTMALQLELDTLLRKIEGTG
jgi:hypothetical protein